MHIPDAYLSPATEAVAFGVMVPLWTIAARKTARELSSKQAPLLSIGAAFCFAIQMFNIPALGGTTAHALGSTLLAILVGPWAALLGLTLSLSIQALLFGDGGILSLGANCWDMGFVACFVGYGVYRLLCGSSLSWGRRVGAAGVAALCGTVAASFSAGVLLGIQPSIAHDAAGHALYCPFGLNVSVPAMVMSHLLVAGPADSFVTVAALAYLWRSFPELVSGGRPRVGTGTRVARKLIWVLILTPLGLIAVGDAWGEWDLDKLKSLVGYVPAGVAQSHEIVHPLLPDYGFAGLSGTSWQVVGYLVSALVGCGVVAGFTRVVLRGGKAPVLSSIPAVGPSGEMPSWLLSANPGLPVATAERGRWFENTLLRLRGTVARSVAAETVAHSAGFLQGVHPVAKAVFFLSALVGVGVSLSGPLLGLFLVVGWGLAWASSTPLRGLAARVGGAVLFFGIVVATPLCFSSGPALFSVFGLAVTRVGLSLALTMLLRVGAGISLAMVWNLTTKWYELLRSLRSLGVPQVFLTTATLTYRYLFVVTETLGEMVEARTARQVGAMDRRQARTYAGSGSAILFSKSLAFTEEMHQAMRSRSFERVRSFSSGGRWRGVDWGLAFLGILLLAMAGLTRAF